MWFPRFIPVAAYLRAIPSTSVTYVPPSVGLRPFTGSGKGMVEMPEGGRTAVIDLTEADVVI
mgnify:CR=1 FL=1